MPGAHPPPLGLYRCYLHACLLAALVRRLPGGWNSRTLSAPLLLQAPNLSASAGGPCQGSPSTSQLCSVSQTFCCSQQASQASANESGLVVLQPPSNWWEDAAQDTSAWRVASFPLPRCLRCPLPPAGRASGMRSTLLLLLRLCRPPCCGRAHLLRPWGGLPRMACLQQRWAVQVGAWCSRCCRAVTAVGGELLPALQVAALACQLQRAPTGGLPQDLIHLGWAP